MEEVCKICNKVFGSRKALGGHMRIHYMVSSSKKIVVEKFKNLSNITCSNSEQSKSYGLLDNLKKTSRFAENAFPCKQCGKGFPTNRSLSGHMKIHPKKSRTFDDSETRKRPKIKNEVTAFYGLNESCSVISEIREVEMAAECLMMLSTGFEVGVGLDLVSETSDDDSDYYGAANDWKMSLSSETLDFSDDPDSKFDVNIKKHGRLNESPIKLHYAHDLMVSDSTQFTELGEADMDEAVSEFVKSNSRDKSGVRAQNSGIASNYSENAYKTLTGIMNQDVSKVDQLNSRKNGVVGSVSLNSSKSKEHKCPICFKVFSSGQAMGGHKRVHFAKSKSKEETDVKEDIDEINDFIDLNFPIAVEGAKADHLWWVEGDNGHTDCQVKSVALSLNGRV